MTKDQLDRLNEHALDLQYERYSTLDVQQLGKDLAQLLLECGHGKRLLYTDDEFSNEDPTGFEW